MNGGNTMWLVCIHHPDRTQALCMGRRLTRGYDRAPNPKQLQDFYREHEGCGGGFDHFTIAYDRDKDHDLPKPAPVADAVHAALRELPGAANDG